MKTFVKEPRCEKLLLLSCLVVCQLTLPEREFVNDLIVNIDDLVRNLWIGFGGVECEQSEGVFLVVAELIILIAPFSLKRGSNSGRTRLPCAKLRC